MARKTSRAQRRRRPGGGSTRTRQAPVSVVPRQNPTISLCLITKDEEKFLQKCIQSVKGLCHQVVVVDTGSTDRTVEIAAANGAEVHHFPWTGSFADARNESNKHATGDWIMILDADGELDPASHSVVRQLLAEYDYPYTFSGKAINYQADGSEVTESMFRILFPNHRGIHYSGAIHEQVVPQDPEVRLENIVGEIFMHHYGYLDSVITEKKKLDRNAALTETALVARPDDFLTHFHAGGHFVDEADFARAQDEYLGCLARLREGTAPVHPKEMWFGLVLASLAGVYAKSGRHQDGVACSREALEYDANDIQAQYWLGYSLAKNKNREESSAVLRRLIYQSASSPISPLFSNKAMQTWMARRELGQNEINLGNYAEAWAELELAVEENPKAQDCWILLSIAACALGNFEVGLEMFGVAATIAAPPESILHAYRALRNEAPRPDPIEAVLRDLIVRWPDNVALKHLVADLLDAVLVVAEAATASRLDDSTNTDVDRVASLWPHWDAARELLTPAVTA